MEESPKMSSRLAGSRKKLAGGGLFGMLAFGPTIKSIFEGAGLMQGLVQNFHYLYSLPDQNWFQIMCLIIAAYFIYSAMRDIQLEDANRRANLEQANNEERSRLTDEHRKEIALLAEKYHEIDTRTSSHFAQMDAIMDSIHQYNEAFLDSLPNFLRKQLDVRFELIDLLAELAQEDAQLRDVGHAASSMEEQIKRFAAFIKIPHKDTAKRVSDQAHEIIDRIDEEFLGITRDCGFSWTEPNPKLQVKALQQDMCKDGEPAIYRVDENPKFIESLIRMEKYYQDRLESLRRSILDRRANSNEIMQKIRIKTDA